MWTGYRHFCKKFLALILLEISLTPEIRQETIFDLKLEQDQNLNYQVFKNLCLHLAIFRNSCCYETSPKHNFLLDYLFSSL